jgi:HK97 family phage major capsid protein
MSWVEIKAANERRAAIAVKMQGIINTAKAESRELKPEEESRFSAHEVEAAGITKEIDRLGRVEGINEQIRSNPTGIPGRDAIGAVAIMPDNTSEHRALRPGESTNAYLASRGVPDDSGGLTFGRYVRAMAIGPKNAEEKRALSEGSDSAGGSTVPTYLFGTLIDLMRPATVCIDAGAQTWALTTNKNVVARVTADPVATWRSENSAVNVSGPTFDSVQFTPHTLAVQVIASRELLEDSVNVEAAVNQCFVRSFSVALDAAGLNGSGSSNQPTGISQTSGIGSVLMGANGAALTSYSPLLQAVKAVETANSKVTSFVCSPRTNYELNSLVDTLGQPLRKPDSIAQIPVRVTTSMPNNLALGSGANLSSIIAGDFRALMFGIRTELRVEVQRELFAGNLQYGFLCYLRADVAVSQPGSFAQVVGIV